MNGVHTRVVPTELPLHVTEITEGSIDTFLLVHGYAGSSYTWHHWSPKLAERGRVVQVDLKGFGEAPKPDDGRYTPTDLADLLVELVRELDLSRLTLVGHSLGGGICLITALRLLDQREPRLERMVLVAAPAYEQRLPPLVPLSNLPTFSTLTAKAIGARTIVRSVLRSIVFDKDSITDEQVEAYAAALESSEGLRAAMDVGRSIVPADLDALVRRYPEIDVPTLLLWGERDPVIPLWVGERLSEDLPRARLVVMPQCGHIPPEEYPEPSFAHVAAFLDEPADAPKAEPQS
jgi:pimeloyl-ACP methyl ester carboxylesterase